MLHIAPDYLYKYKSLTRRVDLCRTLDIIKTGSIFTSPLNVLNDPMEGKAVVPFVQGYAGIGLPRAIEKMPHVQCRDLEQCRILSLSETPVSPQMWAYYADGYKGVCLQFGSMPFEVEPVRYAPRSYRVSAAVDSQDSNSITRARLLTKHIDWSHELEWRAVFIGEECNEYVSLGTGNPTAAILGHECEDNVAQEVFDACEERGIPVFQTYLSDWEFCVRIVPYGFEPAWSGEPLRKQVSDECRRQGIPMIDTW
jgi:hypothetical protein